MLAGKHINLSWNASAGAVTYDVYRGTTSGSITSRIGVGLTSTRYIDTKVTAGTTYYYQIAAVGPSGAESLRSAVFMIKA